MKPSYLEEPESFLDVSVNGKGRELHLSQRLGDTDDGFELADGDGDGQALLGVVLDGLGTAAHQNVLVLQLLSGLLMNKTRACHLSQRYENV